MAFDPDMEEFIRACDGLMRYLNEEEGEEFVYFAYVVRPKTVRLYDDLDNAASSVVISEMGCQP